MDTDMDDVLNQLSSMHTHEQDEMIKQLQDVVGCDAPKQVCQFLLETTNWNLQEAICAFYDNNQDKFTRVPDQAHQLEMQIIGDLTIGEGLSCEPWQRLDRVWRFKNTGSVPWPSETKLKHVQGHNFCHVESIDVANIEPGATTDVVMSTFSPMKEGVYMGVWKLYASGCFPFGENVYCIANVSDTGLMTVTQQMQRTQINESDAAMTE